MEISRAMNNFQETCRALRRRLERFVGRLFSHEFQSRFRWYRKQCGGFWCHSEVMGWEKRHDWVAKLDIELCATNPELYDDGKDIEDYRPQ